MNRQGFNPKDGIATFLIGALTIVFLVSVIAGTVWACKRRIQAMQSQEVAK